MILNIDTNLSVEEIAEKLGISREDITENGEDFYAYILDSSDFDSACNNQDLIENLSTYDKVDEIINIVKYREDEIRETINNCLYEEITAGEDELLNKLN